MSSVFCTRLCVQQTWLYRNVSCCLRQSLTRTPSLPLTPRDRATEAIAAVIEAAKDGAKVVELCRIGDDVITK